MLNHVTRKNSYKNISTLILSLLLTTSDVMAECINDPNDPRSCVGTDEVLSSDAQVAENPEGGQVQGWGEYLYGTGAHAMDNALKTAVYLNLDNPAVLFGIASGAAFQAFPNAIAGNYGAIPGDLIYGAGKAAASAAATTLVKDGVEGVLKRPLDPIESRVLGVAVGTATNFAIDKSAQILNNPNQEGMMSYKQIASMNAKKPSLFKALSTASAQEIAKSVAKPLYDNVEAPGYNYFYPPSGDAKVVVVKQNSAEKTTFEKLARNNANNNPPNNFSKDVNNANNNTPNNNFSEDVNNANNNPPNNFSKDVNNANNNTPNNNFSEDVNNANSNPEKNASTSNSKGAKIRLTHNHRKNIANARKLTADGRLKTSNIIFEEEEQQGVLSAAYMNMYNAELNQ